MISTIDVAMSSNLTFNTLVESHEVESKENFVGVQGLALPFDKTSRNGFKYITESIRSAFRSMVGQPVLFNHDPDKVIGHVEDCNFDGQGMTYRMNVGEDGPFGWVANKLRRGDLKKVSIQCLYDEDKSFIDDEGVMNAWVKEFLELSVVTIPGFADTTAQVYEKFKAKGETKMSKEEQSKQDDIVETSEPQEETPTVEETPVEAEKPKAEESKTEAVDDNEDEEDENKKASEEDDRLGKLEKAVASLKAALDDMKKGDDKDSKESDDEEDEEEKSKESDDEPEEDKEKKVEEAIRNDKQSISTEQLQEERKVLSSADLKELYANFV